VNVVVTNTDTQSGTGTNAFTYQSSDASGTTPGGTVSAAATGGTFVGGTAQFTTPVNPPSGQSFPYGVFSFQATPNQQPNGSITITLTYPQALAAGTIVFKDINGTWVDFTTNVTFNQSRTTITYTITDESQYDSCNNQPGTICDPIGPSIAAASIPSLSEWTQFLLALIVIGIAWHFHNNRQNS
jgi:hypothetical protein